MVLLLAVVTFSYLINGESALQAGEAALVTGLLVFTIIGLPRFLEFRNISKDLLSSGVSTRKRAIGKSELVRATLGTIFYMATILAPLILLFLLPTDVWFGSVFGLIAGFSASQLLFTLRVRLWERARGVRLRKFTVWEYDENNRRVITEFGVRAERS